VLTPPALARDRVELDALERRWAAGEREAALAEYARLAEAGASLELNERYRQRLEGLGDRAALAWHARAYVEQLMARNEDRRALALALDALAQDPAFACASVEGTAGLVRLAERLGARNAAFALARNAARNWPRAPASIALALHFAPAMAEAQGHAQEARDWLAALRDAQRTPELRAELDEALQRLASAGVARP
jgi:hypothetical protein